MQDCTVQLGLRSFIDATGQSHWSGPFAMFLSLLPAILLFIFFQRLMIDDIATTGMM